MFKKKTCEKAKKLIDSEKIEKAGQIMIEKW